MYHDFIFLSKDYENIRKDSLRSKVLLGNE